MTEWFDRDKDSIGKPLHVAQGSEKYGDPTELLMASADAMPDWVKLPDEIGGQTLKPVRQFGQECPMCANGKLVRHMECTEGYYVAECPRHGFVWYRR